MDCTLFYNNPTLLQSLPSPVKSFRFSNLTADSSRRLRQARRLIVASRSEASSHCGFSSLNTPLEPKSPAGRFLSGLLQNDCRCFHVAVENQLKVLDDEREGALARMDLSFGTSEAFLHRKIAELKTRECQTAVEDVIYMLISHKFSEIRVHLVPSLFKCIYNGRLEILPYKDYELESIHNSEVLDMIRRHVSTLTGWRADNKVTENWATTQIKRPHLCKIYTASILYGYFLKSASLRHHLEITARIISGPGSTLLGQFSSYVMAFDPEILEMCAKPRSREAMNIIERHSFALFGDEVVDDVIVTSFASLKRFVLEAIAFGSFLWDSEEYVRSVCKLEDN